jgi:hypothetical protein
MTLPESITLAPAGFGDAGGTYLVPDLGGNKIDSIPAGGGAPSVFADTSTLGLAQRLLPYGGPFLLVEGGKVGGHTVDLVHPDRSLFSLFATLPLIADQTGLRPMAFALRDSCPGSTSRCYSSRRAPRPGAARWETSVRSTRPGMSSRRSGPTSA